MGSHLVSSINVYKLRYPKNFRGKVVGVEAICPRCGRFISWIEPTRRGGRVYYLAVHYSGYYRDSSGKVRKRVSKCYLGPKEYVYVTQLHGDLGLTLMGAIERGRVLEYLNTLLELVINSTNRELLKMVVGRLEEALVELKGRLKELELG